MDTLMDEWYVRLSQRCSRAMVAGETLCERILQTASEMLTDRGYIVNASVPEMVRNITEGVPAMKTVDAHGGQCLLYFDREDRTGVKTVRTLIDSNPGSEIVIVAIDGVTPFARKEFCNVDYVHFFNAKELIHNVTKHSMVPKHEAIPTEEVAITSKRYCVSGNQWPVILSSDPVVRYYGWVPNTIVRIYRKGLTQDEHIFFRRVVRATA